MTSRSLSFQGEVCDAPKSNKKSKGTNWKHAKLLLEAGAAVFQGFEFRNLSAQNEGRFKLFILRIAHVDHLHQRTHISRNLCHPKLDRNEFWWSNLPNHYQPGIPNHSSSISMAPGSLQWGMEIHSSQWLLLVAWKGMEKWRRHLELVIRNWSGTDWNCYDTRMKL